LFHRVVEILALQHKLEALRHPKSNATASFSATGEAVPFAKAIYETL